MKIKFDKENKWVTVNGHFIKCLDDTKIRIDNGEDPKTVIMDAILKFKPGIWELEPGIEVAASDVKSEWKKWLEPEETKVKLNEPVGRHKYIYFDGEETPSLILTQEEYFDGKWLRDRNKN